MQLTLPFRHSLKTRMDKYARLVGIANDLLGQPVPALPVSVGHAVTERVTFDGLHFGIHVPLFFMEKTCAVANQELAVAKLRAINRRIESLGYDSIRQRKPHAACN